MSPTTRLVKLCQFNFRFGLEGHCSRHHFTFELNGWELCLKVSVFERLLLWDMMVSRMNEILLNWVDIVDGGRIYGGRCGSCVSNGFDLTDDLVFGVRLAFAGRRQVWSILRIFFGRLSKITFDVFSWLVKGRAIIDPKSERKTFHPFPSPPVSCLSQSRWFEGCVWADSVPLKQRSSIPLFSIPIRYWYYAGLNIRYQYNTDTFQLLNSDTDTDTDTTHL